MNIGFIGAGKVGCSLGRYFGQAQTLAGYAGKSLADAQEAAELTSSCAFATNAELLAACDLVFITTPDGQIENTWQQLVRECPEALQGKMVAHCSGALPSTVFTGVAEVGAAACSVHPLFAIPSKQTSLEELSHAFFAIEGMPGCIREIEGMLTELGNPYQVIDTAQKMRYHAAAALASNHVVALYRIASDELQKCGFAADAAEKALAPLFLGNARHVAEDGTVAALTGPAERGDLATIEKHLACLEGRTREVYALLNETLMEIAAEKHRSN